MSRFHWRLPRQTAIARYPGLGNRVGDHELMWNYELFLQQMTTQQREVLDSYIGIDLDPFLSSRHIFFYRPGASFSIVETDIAYRRDISFSIVYEHPFLSSR
jgi:hypothetical protein